QDHGEAAPLAHLALDVQGAAVHFGEPLDEDQPQAGSLVMPGESRIELEERLEKSRLIGGADSDTGVPDSETDLTLDSVAHHIEPDLAALRRELHGVGEQVDQNLLETTLIRDEFADGTIHRERDGNLFLQGRLLDQAMRGLAHLLYIDRSELELDLAALDLGDVEDIVDQGEQVSAAVLEIKDRAMLPGVQRTIHLLVEALGNPQDAVERRAQLVTHVRQEFVLEPGGASQLVIGLGQLLGMATEGFFQLLALGNVAHDRGKELEGSRRVPMGQDQLRDRNQPAILEAEFGFTAPYIAAFGGRQPLTVNLSQGRLGVAVEDRERLTIGPAPQGLAEGPVPVEDLFRGVGDAHKVRSSLHDGGKPPHLSLDPCALGDLRLQSAIQLGQGFLGAFPIRDVSHRSPDRKHRTIGAEDRVVTEDQIPLFRRLRGAL